MRTSQGLTLVELLCALAILAIVIGISVKSVSLIQSNQVTTAANQLIGATQFTRTKAISEGQAVFFCLTSNQINCTRNWSNKALVYRNQDEDKKFGAQDELLQTIDFGEAVKIKWAAFQNKSYLEMRPSGMTHFQNGTYTICHKNKEPRLAKSLVMNIAGRPYFGKDKNGNGINEYRNGEDISCE